jgi:phosphoadenosine phosphosulfate reductase
VWAYTRAERLPVHPLYERGWQSIGCAPCTRAVRPGEPERAGRWWWEADSDRECGLHHSTPSERFDAALADLGARVAAGTGTGRGRHEQPNGREQHEQRKEHVRA